MIVAAAQLPGAGGTRAERLRRAAAAVGEAAAAGADLVVLPEAFIPGYAHAPGTLDDLAAARAVLATSAVQHGVVAAMGALGPQGSLLEMVAPDGRTWSYRKRFPTFRESVAWDAGTGPVIADTPLGRVGLLVCADIVQVSSWAAYRGEVDLVIVAAAWSDHEGLLAPVPARLRPHLRPQVQRTIRYRESLLPRIARALGAPLVFTNATGPWHGEERFSEGSAIFAADGRRLAAAHGEQVVVADVGPSQPGEPFRQHPSWRAASAAHRWAARGRAFARKLGELR